MYAIANYCSGFPPEKSITPYTTVLSAAQCYSFAVHQQEKP